MVGTGWERLGHERPLRDPASASTGVPATMPGLWSLLLLWGLAAPCWGLLETVGTLARIDKDELSKGEPGWAVPEGSSCRVNDPVDALERLLSGTDENRMRSSPAQRVHGVEALLSGSVHWSVHFLLRGGRAVSASGMGTGVADEDEGRVLAGPDISGVGETF